MMIGFIGAGSMVGAIARGAVASGSDASRFFFSDAHGTHAPALAAQLGGHTATNQELALNADILVLGVKPKHVDHVLTSIAPLMESRQGAQSPVIVSIVAGRSIASIQDVLGPVPVIRVMPNVNAAIGRSMTGLTASAQVSQESLGVVTGLFEGVGRVTALDEGDFSAFSALAGCSPAWVYRIIDTLAAAGVKHGIPKAQAVQIVAAAVEGSATMVLNDLDVTPATLEDRVMSPGGTTVAGMLAAEDAGLSPSLVKAVDAAVARDRELG